MVTKKKKKSANNVLDLGATLTIDTTLGLLKQFRNQIKDNIEIRVKSSMIESIDLSGIQFLFHLKKVAQQGNIKLYFDFKLSEPVLDLTNKTGFAEILEE